MSIVSSSFLFLFLPLSVLIYHLIPAGKNLFYRNLFLVLVSLFFYAWGEPIYVLLLLVLMLYVYLAGKWIDRKPNTLSAKITVFITAALGIGIILFFRQTDPNLSGKGDLIQQNSSLQAGGPPLGMSFFAFFAISYVVDIYRGKCNSPKSFLHTALYLSAFFKVTQGPIIEYNQFQHQIETRQTDVDTLYRGVKRFLIGLAKKVLIASSLSSISIWLFSDGIKEAPVVNAWIGCVACLVDTFIDFSAYTDMACGLALLFGFRLPENFNDPYTAHSVTEYWQRWHMTLIQWFRDYLYYPVTLGPSVRFRKFLLKHGVKKETAKKLQNIFVPACVWIPTALWHGANLNYLLWGIMNCTACILEMNRKPSGKGRSRGIGGWIYTILFLLLMAPLLLSEDTCSSLAYYGSMFGVEHNALFNDSTWFILKEYGVFLAIGLALSFPVLKKGIAPLKRKFGETVIEIIGDVMLLILSVISIAFAIKTGSSFFIYQMY